MGYMFASDMGGFTRRLIIGDRGSIYVLTQTLDLLLNTSLAEELPMEGKFNIEILWKAIFSMYDIKVSRFNLAMCVIGDVSIVFL